MFLLQEHHEHIHPNVSVRNIVLLIKCSCPLMPRGCEWLGTLRECESHLDTTRVVMFTLKANYFVEKCYSVIHSLFMREMSVYSKL